MSDWISVEDRLPESEGNYITYEKNKPYSGTDFCVCWFSKRFGFDFSGVTHWMPLPESPSP